MTDMLPVATVARVLPDMIAAVGAAGSTAHLLNAARAPLCGRRPRGLADVGQGSALRVCARCVRRLPELTRMHLATLGRPTVDELAPVREHEARAVAAACAAQLEKIREDAVWDGSVSAPVHLVQAVGEARERGGPRSLTAAGHTAASVPMTLGLLIGALMPGGSLGGRAWLDGGPSAGTPVQVVGGTVSAAVAMVPPPFGRYAPAGWRPGTWRRP